MSKPIPDSPHRLYVRALLADVRKQTGGNVPAALAGEIMVAYAVLALADEVGARLSVLINVLEGKCDE